MSLFGVSHEVVIITGASGQLGHSYVQTFLDAGAKVVALDITFPETVVWEGETSENFLRLKADITKKQILEDALKRIIAQWGAPSVLVNNAAIDSPPDAHATENGPFEEYSEESLNRVIEVNIKGTILCCQIFGKAMAAEEKGSIINIASIYGMVSPDQSIYEYRRERGQKFFKPVAYSVTKSAIYNLTRYLAVYWAQNGVRVNSLSLAGVFNNQDSQFLEAYTNRIPIGRMAVPEDYQGAVLFLASSASTYMTGANLVIDGGWTAI